MNTEGWQGLLKIIGSKYCVVKVVENLHAFLFFFSFKKGYQYIYLLVYG